MPNLMTLGERIESILYALLGRAGVAPRPNEVIAARREILALLDHATADDAEPAANLHPAP